MAEQTKSRRCGQCDHAGPSVLGGMKRCRALRPFGTLSLTTADSPTAEACDSFLPRRPEADRG